MDIESERESNARESGESNAREPGERKAGESSAIPGRDFLLMTVSSDRTFKLWRPDQS